MQVKDVKRWEETAEHKKRVKTKDFEEGMKNIGLMIESMRVTMKKKKKKTGLTMKNNG